MTTNTERAEKAIQELTGTGELGKNAAQAIAQALADAGLLMPDRPEPTGYTESGNPIFDSESYRFTVDLETGTVLMLFMDDDGPTVHQIPNPRTMARALEAAAHYITKENPND